MWRRQLCSLWALPNDLWLDAGIFPFYRFRPYGGSLLANAPKVSKRSCPLHPARLRRVPSLHHCSRGRRTRAVPGPLRLSPHPCGSLPSTTIPLGLLMGRLASPVRLVFLEAEQTVGAALAAMLLLCFFFDLLQQIAQATRSPNPVRRPSVGAVERGVWHGCQTRNDGPGMAHRDDPRNSAGGRGVWRSQTRMPGVLSLWLLSLCTSKEKVTRRKAETSRSGLRRK